MQLHRKISGAGGYLDNPEDKRYWRKKGLSLEEQQVFEDQAELDGETAMQVFLRVYPKKTGKTERHNTNKLNTVKLLKEEELSWKKEFTKGMSYDENRFS